MCAVAILYAFVLPISAQSGATGTWRVEGVGIPFPWEVVLRVNGPTLTGRVSQCASPGVEISEGQVEGNTVTFKCKRADGVSTISFVGLVNGDEIAFTWESQLRGGGGAPGAANGLFGPSAPSRFTAKRVSDGALAEAFDQVRGLEFAAAVNLLQDDVKIQGTLFLPQRINRVRSVIVAADWGLGTAFYWDPQVRRLLETTGSGLLLATFNSMGAPGDNRLGAGGRSNALVVLLQRFAEESGHPEVKDAPLLLWGHSAAGVFVSTFAAAHPQRTIAFVAYHSGVAGDLEVLRRIPALLLAGGKDTQVSAEGIQAVWKNGRSVASPWTLAIEPDAEHGGEEHLKKANDLVIPWIMAVLDQRLSPDGTTLRAVTDGSAWMANNRTGDVAPAPAFSASKAEASWLPDESSSRGWRIVTGAAR